MERLLIVEDDKALSEGLGYILREIDYSVEAVLSIQRAYEVLRRENIDLIVLDCNLPDGSGYDFCKDIKKVYHCKVLILTARNTELDEVQAFKAGADDYISKPFSTAVLLERIKNLLRRGESHYLASDGVEVDLTSGRAYLEKEEIELTAVEFKLLCYFIENKNQLLTKDAIIEHVWNEDGEFTDDNNLFVRINRLEGIGIAKEEYPFIFKRFYRGKEVGDIEGSGIGLYLVKMIIEKEKGYVVVKSEKGKGTTISVFLQNSL